jgi:ribonuclease P protein component
MLPKERRISRKEFKEFLKKSRSVYSENASLSVYGDGTSKNPTRFACVVSKKVANKAVERNKIRRHGYAIIQENIEYIRPGFIAILFFKKGSGDLTYEQKSQQLTKLLKKSGIYEKNT